MVARWHLVGATSSGYSKHGNPCSGWNLYNAPRITVKATGVCFVRRCLLEWHVSFAQVSLIIFYFVYQLFWHTYFLPIMTYCGISYMYYIMKMIIVAFCLEHCIHGCHSVVFLRPSTTFMA